MTSARPFVAAAAASVLAALYFVPSASASPDHSATAQAARTARSAAHAAVSDGTASQHLGLADTGSIDTKPYVVGGSAFLVVGAGLVLNAGRRARQAL